MRIPIVFALAASTALAGNVMLDQNAFEGTGGWTVWSQRSDIAPRAYVDGVVSRSNSDGSLALSGTSNSAVHGAWQHIVNGVEPNAWYQLTAFYRSRGIRRPRLEVHARLDWQRPDAKRAGQPDYAYQLSQEGEWTRVTLAARAPEKASSVAVQLFLSNAPQATVWWDDVRLERISAPPARTVRVASVNLRPRQTEDPVAKFKEVIDTRVASADLIVLPEGITVVGTAKKYADVAEPVPGPTTEKLGEIAKRKNSYIVAGIYEKEGSVLYNTAVLLDRKGDLVGRYRKVYLPREEIEAGITPGNDYPVFDTDFGRIGLMICWDVQYADPARALALRGAELIAIPIWGGNRVLAKARAIENRVFLVSSGYDFPTQVINPDGEELIVAREQGEIAAVTLDLNRRYPDEWLGDMRGRFFHELRLDVPLTH
jgi:predicted amidohydrolase